MRPFSLLVLGTAALGARIPASGTPAPGAVQAFAYHHDGVLGTSIDLTFVTASPASAARAEQLALAEIERLRRILSSWDSTSEVSRLFTRGALDHPSPELVAVLDQYAAWNARSGHAYSARVGELTPVWQQAAANGKTPDPVALAHAVAMIAGPAWRIDATSGRVVALTSHRVDLNSLGKGFIIDRAIAAVTDSIPSLRGALINIGGDIHVWGAAPAGGAWRVAVANPRDHADNAVPLTRLVLHGGAVSSSGDYERGFTVGGRHYSHIIDPRTGYPADQVIGVTVIARENATANALATTLSVLAPDQGIRLVQRVPGAAALLITAAGATLRTPGFAAYEDRAATAPPHAATFTAALAIDVTPTEHDRHPPYVAVWITDTAGREVRTLTFWGDKPKYQREMSRWWAINHTDAALIDAVTRATRPAGKYTLEWDGLDQQGNAVAAGPYMFWLEVAFEDGPHSAKSVTVSCGAGHGAGTIPSASAFTGAEISCDPVKP
jgi:thiamine biosynthesis lipoprotein